MKTTIISALKRLRCWFSGHRWQQGPVTPWECVVVCPRCGRREDLYKPRCEKRGAR